MSSQRQQKPYQRQQAVGVYGMQLNALVSAGKTGFDDPSIAFDATATTAATTHDVLSSDVPAYDQPIVPLWLMPLSFLYRLTRATYDVLKFVTFVIILQSIDLVISLLNWVWPARTDDEVIPAGFSVSIPPPFWQHPILFSAVLVARLLGPRASPDWLQHMTRWSGIGHDGNWSKTFQAPVVSDGYSRCPCPALNALSNHGILPRDGRRITLGQLVFALVYSYNLNVTLAVQLASPFYAPFFAQRGWIDLEDIGAQGFVQHDGSLLREDVNSPWAYPTVVATQAKPSRRLIDLYFPEPASSSSSKGPGSKPFTWRQWSAILAHRRADSREHNGQFVLTPLQYFFSSGNAAVLHETIGGDLRVLRPFVGGSASGWEEIKDGFKPKCRQGWGATILQMQFWTILIELGAGPLTSKRMVGFKNDLDAYDGWNADFGQTDAVLGDM